MRNLLLLLTIGFISAGQAHACPAPPGGCVGPSVNIRACGANCTGTDDPMDDDTDAINCALDAVGLPAPGGTSGGEVIIPPATCSIKPTSTTLKFLRLYSNVTIRGSGPKSVLRVRSDTGDYFAIFSIPTDATALSNVRLKDFTVNQGDNSQGNIINHCPAYPNNSSLCAQYVVFAQVVPPGLVPVSDITISGMYFDKVTGAAAINLGTDGDLGATVTDNYFHFVHGHTTQTEYDNSTVYLEGSQQIVSGNTFVSTLSDRAIGAIETHGGRSTITNNTSNNYATLVNVVGSDGRYQQSLDPSDILIANNSITCGQLGITLLPPASGLRNVSITGNTIHICNQQRGNDLSVLHYGPRYAGIMTANVVGTFDNVVIADNIILHEPETRAYYYPQSLHAEPDTGAILLVQPSDMSNVLVRGNVIKDAPISGIRIDAHIPPPPQTPPIVPPAASRIRILDNIIVDAGRNQAWGLPDSSGMAQYRAAIQLVDVAKDVDIMRNMIYDTTSSDTSTNGLYSLNLGQSATSANIRTSQNTVRTNSRARLSSPQASYGLTDATNANDVLISRVVAQSGTGLLAVDFMSFTQYIITVATSDGSLLVGAPTFSTQAPINTQWTLGQLVTFRFLCAASVSTCNISFNSAYSIMAEAGEAGGVMAVTSGTGRAITFQAEQWPGSTTGRSFFEVYRSPIAGVPNP